jgi:hypothetical protein
MHTVADIHCSCCGACLGWKYVRPMPSLVGHSARTLVSALRTTTARCHYLDDHMYEHAASSRVTPSDLQLPAQEAASDAAQKYKEGKYIIEKARVIKVCVSSPNGLYA